MYRSTVLRLVLPVVVLATSATAGAQGTGSAHTVVDYPAGDGPFPAVVLAPGQGYHLGLPAMSETAKTLAQRGVAVYRFNWSYFTREPKGQPSDDLSAELLDLQRVVQAARADARVDASRMGVAGKSLGSLVAWQAFRLDPRLKFAALLTPVCSDQIVGQGAPLAFAANYPALETEARPLQFVLGDADPACEPKFLFRQAAEAKGPVRINVVGGNHGFAGDSPDKASRDAAQARNIGAVSQSVADFAAHALGLAP